MVECGIDRLKEDSSILKGLRLGLITNYTGVDSELRSTIDIINGVGQLSCMFSPEHGVRGDLQAGDQVPDYVDEGTGVKVYSLHGKHKKPTEKMLEDVDALVYDIQDVGARFYTYLYTMSYAMEAAKEFNKKFIVLDRPNPLGGIETEGAILNTEFTSFVGKYPISTRYGLTIGELAKLFNREADINCDLELVEMEGWKREMYFEDTGLDFIAPSPNIPTMDAALVYIGTCLFEGINVSEGRGTTQPFEVIGAPWIDGERWAQELNDIGLKGVKFRPHYFIPTFSKYKNQLCRGVQVHVRDKDIIEPYKVGVAMVNNLAQNYEEFEFLPPYSEGGQQHFDLLAGTHKLRESILNGNVDEFLNSLDGELKEFDRIRDKYIIYR